MIQKTAREVIVEAIESIAADVGAGEYSVGTILAALESAGYVIAPKCRWCGGLHEPGQENCTNATPI